MSYNTNQNKYSENTQENCLLEFLDRYVYKRLYASVEFNPGKEVHFEIDIPNGTEKHVIKGQLTKSAINKPKDSFSFNVLTNTEPGWFVMPELDTDVYVLAFIKQAKVNSYGYMKSFEDIEELELLFIDKREIKNYVNENIYDAAMYETAYDMRSKSTRSLFINNAMYLYYSDALADKPVDLVIKKFALDKLAYMHLLVTKESIKELV